MNQILQHNVQLVPDHLLYHKIHINDSILSHWSSSTDYLHKDVLVICCSHLKKKIKTTFENTFYLLKELLPQSFHKSANGFSTSNLNLQRDLSYPPSPHLFYTTHAGFPRGLFSGRVTAVREQYTYSLRTEDLYFLVGRSHFYPKKYANHLFFAFFQLLQYHWEW